MSVRLLVMARKTLVVAVPTTWNPSDKSASIALSNGNLTATGPTSGSSFFAVRSAYGVAAGKHYWELTGNNAYAGDVAVGIGSATQTLTPAGTLADLEGLRVYSSASAKYQPSTAYGATFTYTDVIGLALDMDAGTLVVYKNNASQGTLVSGLSGTIYAYLALFGASPAHAVTANFGATALAYAPPPGFRPGLGS